MKIYRDGRAYELTEEEVFEASREATVRFMRGELEETFELESEEAAETAMLAYDRYCKGLGETEYDCIEWAYRHRAVAA